MKGESGAGEGSGGGGGGGGGGGRSKKMGSEAAAGMEKFLRDKRSVVRHGKRTVVQTAKGAAFTTQAAVKQRRTEKLKAG